MGSRQFGRLKLRLFTGQWSQQQRLVGLVSISHFWMLHRTGGGLYVCYRRGLGSVKSWSLLAANVCEKRHLAHVDGWQLLQLYRYHLPIVRTKNA